MISDITQRPVLFHIEDEQTAFLPVRVDSAVAVSVALGLNELILNAVKSIRRKTAPRRRYR